MSLIDSFLSGQYLVKRMGPGTYVNGNYVPGCLEEINVLGSMQPTTARALKLPEEGNRLKQYFKFYTDCEIRVISERTLADSDRICINGDWFKTMELTPWQMQQRPDGDFRGIRLPYFMTIIYREPEQSGDGEGSN